MRHLPEDGRTHFWGAEVVADGVSFRLWAPALAAVSVRIVGAPHDLPMRSQPQGWFELTTAQATHGSRYWFVLPDGQCVPDPASRFQPEDTDGPSEVIDPARFDWSDSDWKGRPWEQAVIYELHVGAFSPEGSFQGVFARLAHLVRLGVTAIEIMPVADFPGARNWGYDGVFPYAPDSTYGRPEDFKLLIDAAHACGLMVILDVVYNHFGPEGNYLGQYAPSFFTERHRTPWGAGINFDGDQSRAVRQFFIDNALYWIEEYHLDGLRLDAVHAIKDDSPEDIVSEIARAIRGQQSARSCHLILENEDNEATRLIRGEKGQPVRYTAQWNDDLHHVLHVAATGERTGYYADYRPASDMLGRVLAEGFAFQGEFMPYRGGPRGQVSACLPPTAFVGFIQNHDQIGNRAFGERLSSLATPEALRAIAAVYLLLPQVPMLFMGEEWGCGSHFAFFCDFKGELANQVRNGRREEFARFPEFQDPARRAEIPDPMDAGTFERSKLRWRELNEAPQRATFEWYCAVLKLRAQEIAPRLCKLSEARIKVRNLGEAAVEVEWCTLNSESLILTVNLHSKPVASAPPLRGRILLREGDWSGEGIPAWGVGWAIVQSMSCASNS